MVSTTPLAGGSVCRTTPKSTCFPVCVGEWVRSGTPTGHGAGTGRGRCGRGTRRRRSPAHPGTARFLLLLEAERAVVGGHHGQVVGAQPAPQRPLVLAGPQRRRRHVLGPLEVRPG